MIKATALGAAYLAVAVLTLTYLYGLTAAEYAAGIGITATP